MILNILFILLNLINIIISCGKDGNQCDEWSPCCSSHGFCGNGYPFCGIGCQKNATISDKDGNNLCLLPPACESKTYTFDDLNKFMPLDNYTGNYKKIEWGTTGEYDIQDGNLIIKMPKGSGGGRITSTRYVNFAKITAKLKTQKGAGVVTSFITMAEDHDEIDFEWVGGEPNLAQTNYYYKGTLDFTKGAKHDIQGDSSNDFHEYTIDWKEDELNWLIDNRIVRTLKKQDTLKDGQYNYPSSPSRIEIGLWDGGSGAEGTRQWAGGSINWNNPDIEKQGYLSMVLASVSVECYGPPTSSDNDFKLIFEGKANNTMGTNNQIGNNGDSVSIRTFYNPSNANSMSFSYLTLLLSTLVVSFNL